MSNSVNESALFEVLNAKKLSPPEIAASFVIPPQYEQLVGPDHSFLVGPRGSGKTTLLRMLQGQALMAWTHRKADSYRRRVRYSSIFLPADRLWASQLAASGDGARLGVAAFGTQLLSALVETMLYRIGDFGRECVLHPVELRHRAEVELVGDCAEAWRMKLRTPSLRGLQTALDNRMLHLAERLENREPVADEEDWVRLPPIQALLFGLRAFNRQTGENHHRWALLLDEMELAPESVHQTLQSTLRGGDNNLILKLSFSPFDRYVASSVAVGKGAPDHDYRPIEG